MVADTLQGSVKVKNKYSVLIQGPLNRVSLDGLEYYKTLGPVVITTWADQDKSILEDYDLTGCHLRFTGLPPKVYFVGQANETFSYQVTSIRYGAQGCRYESQWMIRTRSDERWGNLQPLIDRFEQDQTKIVCGNIFFKPWDDFAMHFGDHLFIGCPHTIMSAYQDVEMNPATYQGLHCAEMIAAQSLMKTKGCTSFTKADFMRIFDVIDINELGPFVARWAHGDTTFVNEFNDSQVITSMSEF